MGLIQREIDKIQNEMASDHPRRDELYAAQQALEWALEPGGIKSPHAHITGTPEAREDCPVAHHPLPS